MSGAKCPICKKGFLIQDKAVRVLAEMVERNPDKDGKDVDYWTKVVEWEPMETFHLRCIRKAINEGREFDYEEEINELPLFDAAIGKDTVSPPLQLVEGGKR